MSNRIPVLAAAQFAATFALRPHLFSWFLGAGASAASGIPTGYAMIGDFKKRIFCRETGYSLREVDAGDRLWVERIEGFFGRTALLPPEGDPREYSAAFEAVYPNEKQRRQYIDDAIRKGTPCFGHRMLAALMASKQLSCVFTTNFDALVEESATEVNALLPAQARVKPVVAALDSADRAQRCLDESDWPLIAKLHGDYQSIQIKNTDSELEHQDERMRHVLTESCKRFGLVVVGYSGRDASVMQALESVLRDSNPYPNGLYWVTSSANRLLPAVQTLLDNAVLAGVDVAIVEVKTFDELAADLLAQTQLSDVLIQHVLQYQAPPRLEPVKLPTEDARPFPVLRYSALLVSELPRVARRMVLKKAATTADVRQQLKDKKCRAVVAAMGRELAVFGNDAQVVEALAEFEAQPAGTIELNPDRDSWALGLLYEAMVRALSRHRPLLPRYKRSGHSLIVAAPRADEAPERVPERRAQLAALRSAYESELTGTVPQLGYPYQEGVFLRLEQIEDRWWCGFEPFTFVNVPRTDSSAGDGQDGEGAGRPQAARTGDPVGDWRRERWVQKYNRQWAGIINAWAALLTSTDSGTLSAFGLSSEQGMDAVFAFSPVTGWSRPAHHVNYFDRTK
ncbi:SIR2 family protein [Alcaligenes faecalis]|uniref:SIR2 family protein n=1 Tax=Alcaligenes faecalis TaxID=511 RepID=UPI00203CF2C2|nr:SIR2 family protein [Alcaligenes faecalis]MCM2558770.1 SIR2 family protein [Alcaligenes faecalis]MCM2622638.1 SIR2 family protein [Alcaligenes faecalis]